MAKEFWRWTESRWTAPDIDWNKAQIITAGVDVGSVSSQAVVMTDGELYCYAICALVRTAPTAPSTP